MNKQEKSKLHRFINDNEFMTTYVGGGAEFETTVVDSQRLRRLVRKMNDQPEHQKVKVPECVGKDLDAFTKARLKEDLVKDICLAVYDYSQGTPFVTATVKWCRKGSNLRTMIDAIWNGYEVEEEPKYSVMVAGKYLIKMFHGRKDHKFVNEEELEFWHSSAYKLTQKEIKEVDERYWPFAVPVEKV
jgi:hypothetical protein